ncbi:MAG TPA: SWIB/MDM2 domain-containing protein [Myxococcaceae bacterium]|jgi:chromatin remodeling complex protein RSC6|nr:SWIB/MDM2 domain-containing protein [Myxococcaceae bacterium]
MAAKKTTTAAKKPAAAPAKKTATKTAKRSPNAAFMKEMTPSAALAEIVGAKPLPRTEVVKKLWAYIRKNNLQDPKEKRNINADDKLKPIFGGKKQVSMFEMTKLVNKQLS